MKIGIVGAGIAGLTAAIALAKRGYRSVVFEQAPELSEVGAGVSVSPNAGRVLVDLGLSNQLLNLGAVPKELRTHHYKTGELIRTIDQTRMFEEHGVPYLQVHRADLHGVLTEGALETNAVEIKTNSKLVDAEARDDDVVLKFENGETAVVDVLIGADGLRSDVRRIFFDASEPIFTGHVAWRSVVPMDGLPDFVSRSSSTFFMGPERSFLSYPVRAARELNCVAFARTNQWAVEDWRMKGDKAEVVKEFEGWNKIVTTLIDQIPEGECYKWGLFRREVLNRLYQDRIVLIGDAGHPMLPFMGQGAAMGIEDGMVLARCLAEYGDFKEAMEKYQAARLERVLFVQRESGLQADRYQQEYVELEDIEDIKSQPWQNEDTLGIFKYNPVTVPV